MTRLGPTVKAQATIDADDQEGRGPRAPSRVVVSTTRSDAAHVRENRCRLSSSDGMARDCGLHRRLPFGAGAPARHPTERSEGGTHWGNANAGALFPLPR